MSYYYEGHSMASFYAQYNIKIAKVIYGPGTPRSAPQWVWFLHCSACGSSDGVVHGPFKTRRECGQDIEKTMSDAANANEIMNALITERQRASHH
jgi:hypothetical protein